MVEATLDLTPLTLSAPPLSVLQQLRTATAIPHTRLEARLPLTRPELDHGTYTRIIQAYYGFHAPLQRLIDGLPGFASDPERQKLPALIKDLRALGLSGEDIDQLPLCTDLPSIASQAQLLGVMYVMEGATLGGQVLRRIVADRLGIDADSGGEFLDVYGRDTGRLWKGFLSRLAGFDHPDTHSQDTSSLGTHSQVVDAACATFACFEQWLDRAGVLN